jgi:hypothetical protein
VVIAKTFAVLFSFLHFDTPKEMYEMKTMSWGESMRRKINRKMYKVEDKNTYFCGLYLFMKKYISHHRENYEKNAKEKQKRK